MKKRYTTLLLLTVSFWAQAQTFDFSIQYVGINPGTDNYQMALMATPSSTVTNGVTADMGAGFYIPSGLALGNFVMGDSGLPASEWSAADLNASGDAVFISRTESGSSSVIINGDGPFQLILFDVIADPNPTSGNIIFVENGDPVFDELLFIQNYMNINLGSGSTDAYSQNDPMANSVEFSTLSTSDDLQLSDTNISVYPNPASEYITIESPVRITNVEVFDLLGKRVLETTQTDSIKVNQLNAGVYLLKLYSEKGQLTKKIVVE